MDTSESNTQRIILFDLDGTLVDSAPVAGMMLHVRAGTEVVGGIIKLCRDNGWQGLDCGSGEFIELAEQAEAGLLAWGAYRDQILATSNR